MQTLDRQEAFTLTRMRDSNRAGYASRPIEGVRILDYLGSILLFCLRTARITLRGALSRTGLRWAAVLHTIIILLHYHHTRYIVVEFHDTQS
jgi:hypothetical protein